MNITRTSVALILCGVLAAACSQKRIQIDPKTSTVEAPNVLTLTMEWLKIKSEKFHASVNLTNESGKPALIWLKDITCSAGGKSGDVSLIGVRRRDGPLIFRKNESKNVIFSCALGAAPTSPFKIMIAKVYRNPEGDGHTTDKVLAGNIVLEQVDAALGK